MTFIYMFVHYSFLNLISYNILTLILFLNDIIYFMVSIFFKILVCIEVKIGTRIMRFTISNVHYLEIPHNVNSTHIRTFDIRPKFKLNK